MSWVAVGGEALDDEAGVGFVFWVFLVVVVDLGLDVDLVGVSADA